MLGPRRMDTLHRHRSTRLLIDRYESMSSQPAVQSSPSGAKAPPSALAPKKSLTFLASQKKDKSPIRQSLRNLFSVFKKVNVSGKYKLNESTTAINLPGQILTSSSVLDFKPPGRKRTGPLLYLSRTSQPSSSFPILPVWTACSVTVESNTMVISWLTSHGNPSFHTIQLSNCTDVRSLSSQQLDAEECALLPDTEEFKVFEILFEGRPREKFAAISVRERAEWRRRDAILPSQEPKRRNQGLTEEAFDTSRSEDVIASTMSVPLLSITPIYTERSLPPIPVAATTQDLSVDTQGIPCQSQAMPPSLVSPSIYTPSRPLSCASTITQSRCSSPSIANLGRLSVVKQRLAQIESNSPHPSSGLTTPMWSPQTSGYSLSTAPSLHLEEQDDNSDSLKSLCPSNVRSGIVDSILSSYGDAISISSKSVTHIRNCKEDYLPSRVSPDLGSQTPAAPDSSPATHNSYCLPTNLNDQVLSLQYDVKDLAQELASVIDREADTTKISKTISTLDQRTAANGKILRSIEARTIAAEEHHKKCGTSSANDAISILHTLQSMHQQLATDFPVIFTTLNEIQEGQTMGRDTQAVPIINTDATSQKNLTPPPMTDLSGLHAKLDDLLVGYNAAVANSPSAEQAVPLLKDLKIQASLQAQQQADSLRYLNELNTWLEAFVNNGTSHIHDLVANVDRLSEDLGCGSQRPNDPVNGASNLLTDIRQLAYTMQERDQSIVALQTSVDELSTKLDKNFGTLSNVEIIANMIEHQRRDQESLFRSLTSEISDEIKGERLRFVEAMKEATAINVQIHVEQFKEELTREVLGMTHEVGHLHRERQTIQNQIADLFTFYTKQKQAGEASLIPVSTAQVPPQHPIERGSRHRPLPQPRRL